MDEVSVTAVKESGQGPLAFQDFLPEYPQSGPERVSALFRKTVTEPIASVLERANAWIRDSGVTVISVETVVMPVTKPMPSEEQWNSQDDQTYFDRGVGMHMQFLRVWYHNG